MTGWEVVTQELAIPSQWQLGGGGRSIWTPPMPRAWRRPGFRDVGYHAGFPMEPVFAVTLLDAQSRFLPIEAHQHRWTPACLELHYSRPEVRVHERRAVLSSDVFVSQWQLSHDGDSARDYWLVLWTRRRVGPGERVQEVEANPQGISFVEKFGARSADSLGFAMGSSFDAESWSVSHARVAGIEIDWPSTPFVQVMTRTGLPGLLAPTLEQPDAEGYLFLALAYPVTVPPGDVMKVNFFAALDDDAEQARVSLEESVALIDPIHVSEEEWINWFEEIPSFQCSDRHVQRAYWYWWAQRRFWQHARRPGEVAPVNTDGDAGPWIDELHRSSRQETIERWEELLRRRDDGLLDLPIGLLLRRSLAQHYDGEFVQVMTEHRDRLREIARSGMTDEIAGEASVLRRRALAVDLARAVESLAEPGEQSESPVDVASAVQTIRDEHWSADRRWYVEHLWANARSVKTAHGLLAILAGIALPREVEAMMDQVFDPEHFWTAPPIPSVSRDDGTFHPSTEGIDRLQGRVCPELVSLAIEALGKRPECMGAQDRLLLMELVLSAVRTLFIEGDVDRPACFDSYHPIGGYPSTMLGPSPPAGWLADHILRHVAGLRPSEEGLVTIDPLPAGLEWFRLERAIIGDLEFDVEWDQRSGLSVRLDGQPVGHAPVGRSLTIDLSQVVAPVAGHLRRVPIN